MICLEAMLLLAILPAASAAAGGTGEVLPIGPFKGQVFEGFEGVPGGTYESLGVFGDAGKVTAIDNDKNAGTPVVDVLAGIILGIHVQPRSGVHMMGSTFDDVGFTPAVRWTFITPARRFGGYFATVNFTAGATAFIYDEDNVLLTTTEVTVPNDESWAWNGWEIEGGGIGRIDIFGNGSFGPGLVFHDDMEYDPVPAPGAAVLLLGYPLVNRRRRRG